MVKEIVCPTARPQTNLEQTVWMDNAFKIGGWVTMVLFCVASVTLIALMSISVHQDRMQRRRELSMMWVSGQGDYTSNRGRNGKVAETQSKTVCAHTPFELICPNNFSDFVEMRIIIDSIKDLLTQHEIDHFRKFQGFSRANFISPLNETHALLSRLEDILGMKKESDDQLPDMWLPGRRTSGYVSTDSSLDSSGVI